MKKRSKITNIQKIKKSSAIHFLHPYRGDGACHLRFWTTLHTAHAPGAECGVFHKPQLVKNQEAECGAVVNEQHLHIFA